MWRSTAPVTLHRDETCGIEREFERVLDRVAEAQEAFVVEEDLMARFLETWLEDSRNLGRPMLTGDLYREVLSIAEAEGSVYDISRTSLASIDAFGRHLASVLPSLQRRFGIIERERHGGKRESTFNLRAKNGVDVPSGEDGGDDR